MRCPKCGQDNPDGELFCESCDHRMDRPVIRERAFMPPRYAALIALVLGAVSLVLYFMTDIWVAAIFAGAVGIIMGTYSLRVSRSVGGNERMLILVLAAAATAMSAAGFILGISQL